MDLAIGDIHSITSMMLSDTRMIYFVVMVAMWVMKSRINSERLLQKTVDDATHDEHARLRRKVKAEFGAVRAAAYNGMHEYVYNYGSQAKHIVVVREMETTKRTLVSYLHKFNKATDTFLFKMELDNFVDDLLYNSVGEREIDDVETAKNAKAWRGYAINEIEKLCGKNAETERIIHESLSYEVVLEMFLNTAVHAKTLRTIRDNKIDRANKKHRIKLYPSRRARK